MLSRWASRLLRAAAGVDLVHAHDARAHTLGLLAGKPLVVSRRVAFPVSRGLASRWKYRRAAHFIAVSECVKHALIDAGVAPGKITVVHDGVPWTPGRRHADAFASAGAGSRRPRQVQKIIEEAAALADIPVHFSNNLIRDLTRSAVFVYITDLEGLGSAVLLAMAHGAPVIASR